MNKFDSDMSGLGMEEYSDETAYFVRNIHISQIQGQGNEIESIVQLHGKNSTTNICIPLNLDKS